jgi:Tfp pilus assembly protein PilF
MSTASRSFHAGLRQHVAVVFALIAAALSGCQTSGLSAEKKEDILASQRGIIMSYLDAGNPRQALAELKPMMMESPNDPRFENLMGLIQLTLKNGPRALVHFRRAFRLDSDIGTGINLAAAHIELGDAVRAEKLLKALLIRDQKADEKYPYRERLYHNLGLAALRQDHTKQAENMFIHALEENPNFYISHLELTKIYRRTGRLALAITTLENAREACPVCYDPVEQLAWAYLNRGDLLRAKKLVSRYKGADGVNPRDYAKANDLEALIAKAIGKAPSRG